MPDSIRVLKKGNEYVLFEPIRLPTPEISNELVLPIKIEILNKEEVNS